jgi:hypothetical protein
VAAPDAIWSPFESPAEVMEPVARTARTAAHPCDVVGAAPKVEPSLEYVSVHPAGATMPVAPVRFNRVGSNVCVIVWLIVPAAATGAEAVMVTEPPPLPETEATLDDTPTLRVVADALWPSMTGTMQMTSAKQRTFLERFRKFTITE